MIGTGRDPGAVRGDSVLADAVTAYRQALGHRLVGAYALGSLAHGGFSRWSATWTSALSWQTRCVCPIPKRSRRSRRT